MTRCQYLFTVRAVVVYVQHVDVHRDRSFELPVSGHHVESVPVPAFSVQRLFYDQTPLALVHLDNGKLAQRVSICGGAQRWVLINPALFSQMFGH